MADIVVTTSLDVVDANDGVISLREAIEMANANVDADTITFDASLDGQEINLQSELVITQGTVTIEGDVDGDGNPDVRISGDSNDNGVADSGDTNIITIGSGATVNLDSVHLTEGYSRGADGGFYGEYSGSASGDNASAGITNSGTLTITDSIISDNTAIGGNGYTGTNAVGNGGSASAGILNNAGAVVTINDTLFDGNVATGGNGGYGLDGPDGISYGYGYGLDGGAGGDGGSAASGVANFGLANINNVLFNDGQATGGNAADGGDGGDGNGIFGYGGAGGDGGNGGDGGDATLGILNGNTGTLTGNNTGSYIGTAIAGSAGTGGSGGSGGYYYDPVDQVGSSGPDGSNGSAGIAGQIGNTYFNQGGDVSGFTDTGSAPFIAGGVVSSAGDDILTSGGGNQTLIGLAGNDSFSAGVNTDTIFGGAGNDTILVTGYQYFDNVHGGSGIDTLDHSTSDYQGSDIIDFASGQMTFNSSGQYSFYGALEVSGIEIFLDSYNGNTIIASDTGMTINANGGDDIVSGGMGNDILNGGANGGTGDTLSFSNFTSADGTLGITANLGNTGQQNTGAGIDIITNFENVIGSAFNDTLTGDNFNNTISGGTGDDIIDGGEGDDMLDGGANGVEGDTVSFASFSTASGAAGAGVTVDLGNTMQQNTGAGFNTITNFENIIGSNFNDMLTGNNDNNTIDGGTGDDIINGGGGDDTLNGGANLALSTSLDPVTISGGVAVINAELTNVSGTELLNNFIFTSDGINPISVFTGIAGNEIAESDFDTEIFVFEVNPDGTLGDLVNTNDDINFGTGDTDSRLDFASLPAGDYVVVVGAFNLTEEEARAGLNVNSGSGDFQITIEGATDVGILPSGPLVSGNDTLNGGAGADILNGGDGVDTASYEDSASGVVVFTSGRGGRDGDAQGDRLDSIENIIGSAQQDQIVLNAATAVDNTVNAGDGDDRIRERDGGTNVLNGEDGDDNIFGGTENDTLNGGNDEDNLFGGRGNDTINGGDDAARDVLFGSSGDDTLNGGGGNDALRGNTGMDTLNGGDGTDNLQGGNQNDILNGDAGVDTLDGGAGNDTLNGGTGNDRLTGGGSNDLFIFEDGSGVDRITDFNFGSGDQIDLTDFNLADFDAVMALATEVNGDVRIQLDGDDRLILENITLAELDADDFILSPSAM